MTPRLSSREWPRPVDPHRLADDHRGRLQHRRRPGGFDQTNPAVLADLKPGALPRTAFGLIIEALRRRRNLGVRPVHGLVLRQPPGQRPLARRMLTAFAGLRDPALGDWIDQECPSPAPWSIASPPRPPTPTGPRSASGLASTTAGRSSASPSPSGSSRTPSPPGARIPAGRSPARQPSRALRADEAAAAQCQPPGHGLLRLPGGLPAGRRGRPGPGVPGSPARLHGRGSHAHPAPVPGIDLDSYKHTLIERFSNPQIRDTIARLCADSSDRIPKWLLPVIRQQLATGGEMRRSAAVVASWARYAEGVDEDGQPIEIVDRLRDTLIRSPAASATTRTHSSPTARFSETWPRTSPSSPPTDPRWPRCTTGRPGDAGVAGLTRAGRRRSVSRAGRALLRGPTVP